MSPATPLEPCLAAPNHVLESGVGKALHPHAALFCATILLCDPRPPAARALLPCFAGPLHVISQNYLFLSCRVLISFQGAPKNGSAMRRERGPATETKSGGERTLIAANGPRSQSKIVAQERLQPCGCRALPTPPPSTRFGKARWGSRGQAGD